MLDQVLNKTFDYVIVGGGTAGLALAARLSESTASVLVLETGLDHDDNDRVITSAEQSTAALGNPKYSEVFITQPKSGTLTPWFRGRGLGGTSLVNLLTWITPPSQDMDAIESLGNPGWGWNTFVKYLERARTQIKLARPHHSKVLDNMFFETLVKFGVKENPDTYQGNTVGYSLIHGNLDPTAKPWTRSSSRSTYYVHVKDRPNLTFLTEATVSRILFDSTTGYLNAIGAEFILGEETYTARCNKEVILCAGCIRSPQLLELSGIGRRDVIEKIGVELKLELPGVGENVQEHTIVGVLYEINPEKSIETVESMQDPAYVEARHSAVAEAGGTIAVRGVSFTYLPLSSLNPEGSGEVIMKVEQEVEKAKESKRLAPGLAEQYKVQLNVLRDPKAPDCQIILHPGYWPCPAPCEQGKRYVSIMYVGNRLFSRGTIHAKSTDPADNPAIFPNYYGFDYDVELMKQQIDFGRKIVAQEPFKSVLLKQVYPEEGANDAEFIKENSSTLWHTVGSCSMLPREKNGVVSPELVVYGTKNLRVVDISIMPLHVATHCQSVAYGIAEKAADMILGRKV